MWRYIIRRLLWVIVVLLAITFITYVMFFVMPPVNPAVELAGKAPTPQIIATIKQEFGLNHPWYIQYLLFVKHLFLGDQYGWPGLGFSFVYRTAINGIMASRMIITLQLAIGAAIIWMAIGIPIGVASAVRQGSFTDRLSMGLALFFYSAPVFWLGLVFLWLFWFKFGWASGAGYVSIGRGLGPWLSSMIMPWVVLALLFAAFYARMTRSTLIETMGEDFIRTARAKGLPEWKVIYKHGLRASITPIITMFGMDLGALIGGAIITETVFNLQGVGQWTITSVYTGDLPAILAIVIVASFAITFANLLVDIAYAFIDPRVRYA